MARGMVIMTNYDLVLDLEAPHGFLMAQEKQTAIARIEPLDTSKSYLIVCNGEAFGIAELDQPAQVKTKEFDSEDWLNQHRVMPRERRQWWPDADNFYIYRLKSWQPFEGVKFYENEQVIDEPKLTAKQWKIVNIANKLPKQIVLIDGIVSISEKYKFDLAAMFPHTELLKDVLQATFEIKPEFSNDGKEFIPLYSLALVRNPRMRVSKKNTIIEAEIEEREEAANEFQKAAERLGQKQEDENMPFRIRKREGEYCVVKVNPDDTDGDEMGCHGTEDEAEAQLVALRINVEAEEKDFFGNEQSEEQRLDFIRRQFESQFNPSDDDEIAGGKTYVWVNDIFESFIIIDEAGRLFRVDYMMLENGIIFADKEQWVEVERGYRPKGFKHLVSFERKGEFEGLDVAIQTGKAKTVKKAGFMDNLRSLSKSIGDFLKSAETEEKEVSLFVNSYGIAQKEVNGELWHFTWSTNAFRDREKEIFSTKSLQRYVEQAKDGEDKGLFNFWHIAGTDFAEKQWQMVIGRFLVEAGPYLKDHRGEAAKEFFSDFASGHPDIAPEGWGCSPEYRYLPEERATGVYENIWITRTSTLPRMKAANIWTETSQLARKNMAITDYTKEQIEAAVEVFKDEDFVKSLIQQGETKTAELENVGVAHKSNDEPQEIELNMGDLAAEVGKQFTANLQPIADAMEIMEAGLKEISERLEKVELGKAVEDKAEKPRFIFNLQRASEDKGTIVTEDDGLKNQKPAETKAENNDAWSQMFSK